MRFSNSINGFIFTAILCLFPITHTRAQDTVSWFLNQNQTFPGSELCVPCGNYGFFHFWKDFPLNVAGAQEQYLLEYPKPGSIGEIPPDWDPAGEPWWNLKTAPWVAVMDVFGNDTTHGILVGLTIHELSDPQVNLGLYPLDDPLNIPDNLDFGGVSDFHVLIRLCDLLDGVDKGRYPPPLALNMGFGRWFDVASPDSGGSLSSLSLNGEVQNILDELFGRGITLIAAAGNYEDVMFPAYHEKVLAVGRLNLHAYDGSPGSGTLYFQNPANTLAYMPGDGLSLIRGSSQLDLPQGSSFSAAIFTAWSSPYLRSMMIDDLSLLLGEWFPVRLGSAYYLANQPPVGLGVKLNSINQAIDNLFYRLQQELLPTQPGASPEYTAHLKWDNPTDMSSFQPKSLPSFIAENYMGAPEPKPPCGACNYEPDQTSDDLLLMITDPICRNCVDDCSQIELKKVYLQVGENTFYGFDNFGQNQYQALQGGNLVLRLVDVFDHANPNDQLSLVFSLLCKRDGVNIGRFWTSVNIIVPQWFSFPSD